MTFFEKTIGYQYEVEGNVQPLVDYLLSEEVIESVAREYLAKVLTGEIKKGDKRRVSKKARAITKEFYIRRKAADCDEIEHKTAHVPDADIYAQLDIDFGYTDGTSDRMIKRYQKTMPRIASVRYTDTNDPRKATVRQLKRWVTRFFDRVT